MDIAGARVLRDRIEQRQQEHWLQAAAVQSGLQDGTDPDADHLISCRGAVRLYEARAERRFAKRLVGGRWRTIGLLPDDPR